MDCAHNSEKHSRRVTQEWNEILDHEAHKNSTPGDEDDLNIMRKYTKLKFLLKQLNTEYKAVCDQRDELNDLLGKMMHKNVRLKVREDLLKDKNKKVQKKLQKKKLMMTSKKDWMFQWDHETHTFYGIYEWSDDEE